MRHLLGVLLLTATAVAAECPIAIEKVVPFPRSAGFAVRYRNTSDKTVKAAEFHARTFDAVGDPHDVYGKLIDSHPVKPGKLSNGKWDVVFPFVENSRGGAEAYLQKLIYEDGTKWEDDGSKACRGEYKR
jgi:hypothetical protein